MQNPTSTRPETTGCRQIDRDHEILFELVARLGAAIEGKGEQRVLDRIMLELEAYFDAHFDNEEEFMAVTKYPDIAPHKAEHEVMRGKYRELSKTVRSGGHEKAKEILALLYQWFAKHVEGTDLQLGRYLSKTLF